MNSIMNLWIGKAMLNVVLNAKNQMVNRASYHDAVLSFYLNEYLV